MAVLMTIMVVIDDDNDANYSIDDDSGDLVHVHDNI